MTFLTLFGAFLYADSALLDTIANQKEQIITHLIKNRFNSEFDYHYQRYKDARKSLRERYRDYHHNSQKYNKEITNAGDLANQHWKTVKNRIDSGWDEYQDGSKKHENKAGVMSRKLAPKIFEYFEYRNIKCKSNACKRKVDKRYRESISQTELANVPAEFWLIIKKRSFWDADDADRPNTFDTAKGGDLLSGSKKQIQKHHYSYTNVPVHYEKRIIKKLNSRFLAQTGYPYGISSFRKFRAHEQTSKRIRTDLNKKYGLQMDKSWLANDRRGFKAAVINNVKEKSQQQWQKDMLKKGINMPPNLSWQEFQLHPEIQSSIKRQMGTSYYVEPMKADWNNEEFRRKVIVPNINEQTTHILSVVKAKTHELQNGGRWAEDAKTALRATIIPPISMTLSLFLIILTLIKLPGRVFVLFQKEYPPAFTLLPGIKYFEQYPFAPKLLKSLGILTLIIFVPLMMLGNRFTNSESTVNYFFQRVETSSSITVSYALQWAMVTQPYFQHWGQNIENTVQMTPMFSRIQPILNEADDAFFSLINEIGSHQKKENLQALHIKTNVVSASIRVMNIKPKYEAGIMLKDGIYDVQVSAEGYKSLRKNIELRAGSNSHNFKLQQI